MRLRLLLTAAGCLAGLVGVVAVTAAREPQPTAQPELMSRPVPAPRRYPSVPQSPQQTAELLAKVEAALRNPTTPAAALPDLGHQQQVIYRVLSADPVRSSAVLEHLPDRWTSIADRHLAARREFLRMSRGRGPSRLPAWRIIAPEPADQLLSYYRKAEAATGIAWEVLAAVNLVETGMGRIDGISVANAQGPMQFLPTTWAEPGIGAGDIRNPHDAIQAAARYLVRRGGLQNIRQGLWGYNNSDYYGRAVLLYASLMEEDPRAYTGLYHWEIHFNAAVGDLWLPVGYNQPQPIGVNAYLQRHPGSRSPN
jgi:membrane-bound lytic murein transglycosylase B